MLTRDFSFLKGRGALISRLVSGSSGTWTQVFELGVICFTWSHSAIWYLSRAGRNVSLGFRSAWVSWRWTHTFCVCMCWGKAPWLSNGSPSLFSEWIESSRPPCVHIFTFGRCLAYSFKSGELTHIGMYFFLTWKNKANNFSDLKYLCQVRMTCECHEDDWKTDAFGH